MRHQNEQNIACLHVSAKSWAVRTRTTRAMEAAKVSAQGWVHHEAEGAAWGEARVRRRQAARRGLGYAGSDSAPTPHRRHWPRRQPRRGVPDVGPGGGGGAEDVQPPG